MLLPAAATRFIDATYSAMFRCCHMLKRLLDVIIYASRCIARYMRRAPACAPYVMRAYDHDHYFDEAACRVPAAQQAVLRQARVVMSACGSDTTPR